MSTVNNPGSGTKGSITGEELKTISAESIAIAKENDLQKKKTSPAGDAVRELQYSEVKKILRGKKILQGDMVAILDTVHTKTEYLSNAVKDRVIVQDAVAEVRKQSDSKQLTPCGEMTPDTLMCSLKFRELFKYFLGRQNVKGINTDRLSVFRTSELLLPKLVNLVNANVATTVMGVKGVSKMVNLSQSRGLSIAFEGLTDDEAARSIFSAKAEKIKGNTEFIVPKVLHGWRSFLSDSTGDRGTIEFWKVPLPNTGETLETEFMILPFVDEFVSNETPFTPDTLIQTYNAFRQHPQAEFLYAHPLTKEDGDYMVFEVMMVALTELLIDGLEDHRVNAPLVVGGVSQYDFLREIPQIGIFTNRLNFIVENSVVVISPNAVWGDSSTSSEQGEGETTL